MNPSYSSQCFLKSMVDTSVLSTRTGDLSHCVSFQDFTFCLMKAPS